MNEIVIRKATREDIPFLAKMILLAETSGKELISYRDMFDLPEEELIKGFEIALDNDQLGHGLTYLTFLIAEYEGNKAATACGYVEGEFGSSNHLMTGALITGFGTELVVNAYQINSKFKKVQIAKTLGTLQIDSVATLSEFRGKGLYKLLFEEHCKGAKSTGCGELEIQVWAGNDIAVSTNIKLGCEIIKEKYLNNEEKNLGGRLVMSKRLN